MSRQPAFPFSAIVGQAEMKQALRLIAANPGVGGLLIRGERGTAKSTAVRALAALLPEIPAVAGCPYNCDPSAPFADCPHCRGGVREATLRPVPFVELPVGATEDRVMGALDVGRALKSGDYRFEPGLVARAHRGILYIDEVNLLPDHLVDVLLDAAASGWNTVEREGVSVSHPAQFILVGTMNPEEGELRPQFLDRFAMAVDVGSLTDAAQRAEAVTRYVAYEQDTVAFAAAWWEQEAAERQRILAARDLLPQVTLPPEALGEITGACMAAWVEGIRADIVSHKAARSLAALAGRTRVEEDDIATALRLSLNHRQRQADPRRPPASPPPPACQPPGRPREHAGNSQQQRTGESAADEAGGGRAPPADGPAAERQLPVGPALALPKERREHERRQRAAAGRGLRLTRRSHGRGRSAGAVLPRGPVTAVALVATLRAAATRSVPLRVTVADLRQRLFAVPLRRMVLFVVDASGSMGVQGRMAAAKGAALTLLADAYRRRDRVALIAFRGQGAELALPLTRSVRLAARRLQDLPTGGRTPLAAGLEAAQTFLARSRQTAPDDPALVVIMTDGRANQGGEDPVAAAFAMAQRLDRSGARFLVIDTESGYVHLGLARRLAALLGGRYLRLDQLTAGGVAAAVRNLLLESESRVEARVRGPEGPGGFRAPKR